jgi:hypothetical protein
MNDFVSLLESPVLSVDLERDGHEIGGGADRGDAYRLATST